MIKNKIFGAIPLALLTLGVFFTLYDLTDGVVEFKGQQFQSQMVLEHYLAIISLVINWVLYLSMNRFYLPSLIITCILGSFSIFWFTPLLLNYYFSNSFSISGAKLGLELAFEPFSFVVLIVTLIVNFGRISSFVSSHVFIKSEEQLTESIEPNMNLVSSFKKKFANKSIEELAEIVSSKGRYQTAAIIAAEDLITEKRQEENS